MRVCNLFLLPAAGDSRASEKQSHGGPERQRPLSAAHRRLLAGLGRPTRGGDTPLRRPRVSQGADNPTAALPRRRASPRLRWTGRTKPVASTRPGPQRLLSGKNPPRAHKPLPVERRVGSGVSCPRRRCGRAPRAAEPARPPPR